MKWVKTEVTAGREMSVFSGWLVDSEDPVFSSAALCYSLLWDSALSVIIPGPC